jgi:RHS repeat-associated protein
VDGEPVASRRVISRYSRDGLLHSRTRQGDNLGTFHYDDDGRQIQATETAGTATRIETDWNVFGEAKTVRQWLTGLGGNPSRTTAFTYDEAGNLAERTDGGRRSVFTYNRNDWLTEQLDLEGLTKLRKLALTYYDDGLIETRTVNHWNGTSFQQVTWTKQEFYDNDQLKRLEVKKSSSGALLEEHDLVYWTTGGIYMNGNRVKDTFRRAAPADTTRPCEPGGTACAASYTYDARDRLTHATDGHGGATEYELDVVGNVKKQTVNLTGTDNDVTITQTYDARNRLKQRSENWAAKPNVTRKYWYTPLGDLWCVTNGQVSGGSFDCANPGAHLDDRVQMYAWDASERLISTRTFNTSGSAVVRATYEYDGLDRPTRTRECHGFTQCSVISWWTAGRETEFKHLGVSSLVAEEAITGSARTSKSKRYSYDSEGARNTIETTNPAGTSTAEFAYVYDAHGSVGLLVKDNQSVQASYGYDPYGGEDAKLTKELNQAGDGVTSANNPLNAYRYTGKREDTGSNTLDMGARRFSPDTARFMSTDFYAGAYEDIGLSTDPLTQNRYALAGGNPAGYVEWDGHFPLPISITVGSHTNDTYMGFAEGVAIGLEGTVRWSVDSVNVTNPEKLAQTWQETANSINTIAKCASKSNAEACEALGRGLVAPCQGNGRSGSRTAGCVVGNLSLAVVGTKGVGSVRAVGAASRTSSLEAGASVRLVNGRKPINSKYAGKTHPAGVQFTDEGFPDFAPFAKAEYQIAKLTGDHVKDEALANAVAGLRSTPKGMTWHHVEDTVTMQLVPTAIHTAVRHTGGAAMLRNRVL